MNLIFTNMKTKATYFLFFALLVSNITYCTAQNSSGFHHFWLVQVWPFGYCLEVNCARNVTWFVLHGLWPVNAYEQTLPGTNKPDPGILASVFPLFLLFFVAIINLSLSIFFLKIFFLLLLLQLEHDESLWDDLKKYWLSLSTRDGDRLKYFWPYQWRVHGSAQRRVKPPDYFRRAVELTKFTDLLNTLNRAGIMENGNIYRKVEFRKAIKAKTGYDPILSCVFSDGRYQLKEVTICVDADATNFIPCNPNKISRESCRNNIKFPAPSPTKQQSLALYSGKCTYGIKLE